MKIFFLLIGLMPLYALCQEFENTKDDLLNEKYVRYFDRNAGVIIQKVTNSSESRYELALIIYSRGRDPVDFLKQSSAVVFDDNSTIAFNDPVQINYFQEGKHQYSIRHILSESEFAQLKQKKIDRIIVCDRSKPLDRWQKADFLKACAEIENK